MSLPPPAARRCPAVALVTLVLLTAALARPAEARVSEELRARAADRGAVRVIVRLDVEAAPEGSLPSPAAVRAQRDAIGRAQAALAADLVGTPHGFGRRFETIPFVALQVGPAALSALGGSDWVVGVEQDRLLRPLLASSVPVIQGDVARGGGFDGGGWAVAILDTGVEASHPFLTGRVVAEACFSSGKNPLDSRGDCPNGSPTQLGAGSGVHCTNAQGCFHGTHVAGIVAGNSGAPSVGSGVASGAALVAVQVFSEFTGADCLLGAGENPCALSWTSDQIAGLEHVLALRDSHAIAAVNLSLGGGAYTSQAACDGAEAATKAAIDNLRSVGIATVAASGNEGSRDTLSAPACISSAISVGATTDADQVASFSNAAPFLSLLAPGVDVTSSVPGDLFGYEPGDPIFATADGTSMATPHVAGAWALLRQAAPSDRVGEMLAALRLTGLPVADQRAGGFVTTPRVRVFDAIQTLLAPDCSDGIDNDEDGFTDFPEDPGCGAPEWHTESPECQDGEDNDGDGRIDFDGGASIHGSALTAADPQCGGFWAPSETGSGSCGLGFELALLLPMLRALHRRRRRGA